MSQPIVRRAARAAQSGGHDETVHKRSPGQFKMGSSTGDGADSDRCPDKSMLVKSFILKRKRIADEMTALEAQDVTEADIAALTATKQGLDARFSDLWEIDLAAAHTMLVSKLEVADGG